MNFKKIFLILIFIFMAYNLGCERMGAYPMRGTYVINDTESIVKVVLYPTDQMIKKFMPGLAMGSYIGGEFHERLKINQSDYSISLDILPGEIVPYDGFNENNIELMVLKFKIESGNKVIIKTGIQLKDIMNCQIKGVALECKIIISDLIM